MLVVSLLALRRCRYGLGNRLRSLKSALLLAMLTGRVFRVEWEEPFPFETLVRVEAVDWRRHAGARRDAAAQRTEVSGRKQRALRAKEGAMKACVDTSWL
eukprot:6102886-Pleurochrysis_carterae.AAC.2